LALWRGEAPITIESDAEALRLRTRIETVEDAIAGKEAELKRLRRHADAGSPDPDPKPPAHEDLEAL
jgi:hypothetical protein